MDAIGKISWLFCDRQRINCVKTLQILIFVFAFDGSSDLNFKFLVFTFLLQNFLFFTPEEWKIGLRYLFKS